MESLLRNWIDAGFSPEATPPAVMRRVRLMSVGTLSLCMLSTAISAELLLQGLADLVLPGLAVLPAAAANLVLLRRTQNIELCTHVGTAIMFSLIVFSNLNTGGFLESNFGWFYVVPLVALLLGDLRAGWIWSGVVALTTMAFWSLEVNGFQVVDRAPFAEAPLQHLFNRLSAVFGLSIVASCFVWGQRRAERDLVRANAEMLREAKHVQILQRAAIAANQSTSVFEALRVCVEETARIMGWSFAHVFVPNDAQQRLDPSDIAYCEDENRFAELSRMTRDVHFETGVGLPGRVHASGQPAFATRSDPITGDTPRAGVALEAGVQSAIAFPVLGGGRVLAVLEFFSTNDPEGEVDERLLQVLASVGAQLGRVSERRDLQSRLRQSQKMEAVGQLAAGIAHEINNPMAYVRANLSLLRGEWDGVREDVLKLDPSATLRERLAEFDELLDESLEGVDRTIEIVREVKQFAHTRDTARVETDLGDLVEKAVRTVEGAHGGGVAIERALDALPVCPVSPGQIQQVLVNLIANAVQAAAPSASDETADEARDANGGHVRITGGVDGETLWITVADDGPGIPEQLRSRLFDPFFTTKKAGEGTGLGLYISYEFARLHAGEIAVDSRPGEGAAFTLRLPLPGEAR